PMKLEGIPERINEILMKCLEKDREVRWKNCNELKDVLEGKIELDFERKIREEREKKQKEKEERERKAAQKDKGELIAQIKKEKIFAKKIQQKTSRFSWRIVLIGLIVVTGIFALINPGIKETIAKREVKKVLDNWVQSLLNRDIMTHTSIYANKVNYFTKNDLSNSEIFRDKKKAFDLFQTMDMRIEDVEITINNHSATTIFIKYWNFNGEKSFSGKEKEKLVFKKSDNTWKIIEEKELVIFWVEKDGKIIETFK
ncbi:MAG: hypothetical protein ACETWM_13755, partial [Candidatus Lokiarchaeia archaeon]